MTNQSTDEAAVGPNVIMLSGRCGRHYDAECQSCKSARECSDAEILRLNAQLTAATRRAEQAERILAEAVKVIEPFANELFPGDDWGEDLGGPETMASAGMVRNAQAFLTTIRSAASGEQG